MANAVLKVSTGGGQRSVETRAGALAAIHDGEQWRRNNRNGSTTRMPNWTDTEALAHGEARYNDDFKRAAKVHVDAVKAHMAQLFTDRRMPPRSTFYQV